MPVTGTPLKPREVTRLCWNAGWRDEKLIVAVAVVFAESSGYPLAWNDNLDDQGRVVSTDRGLLQVNSIHIGKTVDGQLVTSENLFDAAFNVQVGYSIYKGNGYSFRPWVAYTSDAWRKPERLLNGIEGVRNMWRARYGLPLV